MLLVQLSRVLFGTIAAFVAIIVWSRSRDLIWMLLVGSILLLYGEVLLTTLDLFGLVRFETPLLRIALASAPLILFASACIVYIRRG